MFDNQVFFSVFWEIKKKNLKTYVLKQQKTMLSTDKTWIINRFGVNMEARIPQNLSEIFRFIVV